ncbi:hypothetical protein TNCT_253121 [Trichonephila clavata]|uniref:Uncharacterized protein n=1 Tax=Trichonephila clavata TaxID=2740835 RepID=A0A8X6J6M3_TRICU|nr:hypothetical protein TNCT_253121 [Trichonephila clavata]
MPCGQIVNSPDELLSKVYPNNQQNFKDPDWLSHRAILASRNDVDEKLNVTIQKQLSGQEYPYKSIDCIINDDEAVQYPTFLNSIQNPDLQAHNLILKASPISVIARSQRRWASFHILWKIWDITVGHAAADIEGGEDGIDTRSLLSPWVLSDFSPPSPFLLFQVCRLATSQTCAAGIRIHRK